MQQSVTSTRVGLALLAVLMISARAVAAPVSYSIKLDHFGYRPSATKVAIFTANPGSTVEVRNTSDQVIYTVPTNGGSITSKGTDPHSGDSVWWVDFSGLSTAGTYRLYSATLAAQSYDFTIGSGVYAPVVRKALKTFYHQRCNTPKASTHAGNWADTTACHAGDSATTATSGHTNEGTLDLTGGWHDAGDYNKYVWKDTATALYFLLRAYEDNPTAFQDGDLDIPESSNGVPDILDEVKWELDWMLKMQLPSTGAVLSRTHALGFTFDSPPSADTTVRYYQNPTIESAAVLAGSCAYASRIYRAQGMTTYANTLEAAANSAWNWLGTQNDSSQPTMIREVKLWAAAEIFRINSGKNNTEESTSKSYVDTFYTNSWGSVSSLNHPLRYNTLAAFTYVPATGANATVVTNMRNALTDGVNTIIYYARQSDYYANGMQGYIYDWSSNASRAAHGVFLQVAANLGTMSWWLSAADLRKYSEEFLHFFHGQNPLSMVYLSNMSSLGGEHSVYQLYHGWYGASGVTSSATNYIGKPSAVTEPDYPYYKGTDNHGVSDNKSSLYGPAPGYIPGGPNQNYGASGNDCSGGGTATPPLNTSSVGKYYRDWNDQTVWTACTWRINENSIGVQGPYVALGSYFMQ